MSEDRDPPIAALIRHLLERGVRAYFVGGYVRDVLLGRESYDVDLVVDGDAIRVGRDAANALGGAFYVLDPERGAGRVILSCNGETRDIDFTRQRGGDIEQDLRARDFTVNAMAFPVASPIPESLIDPLGGQADLAARRLRAASDRAIQDDPIRTLRAIRLAHQLNLYLDRTTRSLVVESTPLLIQSSSERIRDELLRMLLLSPASGALVDLHETGALWAILEKLGASPMPAEQRETAFARAAELVTNLDALLALEREGPLAILGDALGRTYARVMSAYVGRVRAELSHRTAGGRSRALLLKLIALFIHTLGDSPLLSALAGLRLSSAELQTAQAIAAVRDEPPLWAARGGAVPAVELHRFFRRAGAAGIEALVLYLSDSLTAARRGEGISLIEGQCIAVESGFQAYFERYGTVVLPPTLVTGDVLIDHFGIAPGRQVGELLERLREAQAEGRVHTEGEALALLESWVTGETPGGSGARMSGS